MLRCVLAYRSELKCVAVCCSVLLFIAVNCSVLQRDAACYSVWQCVAADCRMLKSAWGYSALHNCSILVIVECCSVKVCCGVWHYIAGCRSVFVPVYSKLNFQCIPSPALWITVHCSVLQCIRLLQCATMCCKELQRVKTRMSAWQQPSDALCCSVLQNVAVCCSVL